MQKNYHPVEQSQKALPKNAKLLPMQGQKKNCGCNNNQTKTKYQ